MASLNPRITVEPGKMGSQPCTRGLRFTIYDLPSYLAPELADLFPAQFQPANLL